MHASRDKSALDYVYGWLWLLPRENSEDRFALLGFSEQERAFLEEALSDTPITTEWEAATIGLVQDLPLGDLSLSNLSSLHSVCVVGSCGVVTSWHKALAGHFQSVHDYALLPPDNPRLVIPLGVPDWTAKGLALHRPGRALARLKVALVKQMARFGYDRPLRLRTLCIAHKSAHFLPQGARQAGLNLSHDGQAQDFALYLGNPRDNRKTVVLPLGDTSRTLLKCGESSAARAALRNEAETLKFMGHTPLAAQVPELLDVVECGDKLTLCQEYRARAPASQAVLNRAVIAFLGTLSRQNREQRPLADVLAQSPLREVEAARVWGQTSYAIMREWLDEMAASGAMVWGHRSHGDFAPWNCSWTTNGFFVFDWEESRKWDVGLCDAFYFVVAPAVYVTRSPDPLSVKSRALKLAMEVAKIADFPVEGVRLNWVLWLLWHNQQRTSKLYKKLLEIELIG